MPSCTNLIAAVDLNHRAEGIVRRAARLAALCHGRLILLHVVEFDAGYESDYVPLLTPDQVRGDMERQARAWLLGLACHLNLTGVEIIVRSGRLHDVVTDLALERQARYILTGSPRWGVFSRLGSLARERRLLAVGCDLVGMADEWRSGRGEVIPV